jgi:hypothetical protein
MYKVYAKQTHINKTQKNETKLYNIVELKGQTKLK